MDPDRHFTLDPAPADPGLLTRFTAGDHESIRVEVPADGVVEVTW